jgi:hypothetical protein
MTVTAVENSKRKIAMNRTLLAIGMGTLLVLSGCSTNSPGWGIFSATDHPYNPYQNTEWVAGYWAADGLWVAGHWEYDG